MNIQNILSEATRDLKKFNIKTPLLDSEILLCNVIKKDRRYIIINSNQTLKVKDVSKFKKLIEKRKRGKPIAYLTNQKDFWKHTFYVNENVLIPRPDTELIVEQVLKIYKKNTKIQVLDIGTGSGCILLSLLKERSDFYGTGIDISKKSINVSKYNAKMLQLTNRVRFYNSDVDNFIIGKYDLIISNPPYIELTSLKYLDKSVVGFEPKLALNGGLDGFQKLEKLFLNQLF